MSDLDSIDRVYFEDLFEMASGYVLDFTNRSFQEFVYETIKIDVYSKYDNLSKAKILRRIIDDYDNFTVGKLLLQLLRYMQVKDMITSKNQEKFKKCQEIGNRLIGRKIDGESTNHDAPSKSVIDYAKFLEELKDLANFSDAQARGFAFEKYLRKLFEAFSLEPRRSFRIEGEQIDGSFVLHNEVYLLEAKWTDKYIDKNDLVIFNGKVASKSGFTRGLYVSFSRYSEGALKTFSNGRTINIILMTVEELAIALSRKLDLRKVLEFKTRALADEGNFNKSVIEMW